MTTTSFRSRLRLTAITCAVLSILCLFALLLHSQNVGAANITHSAGAGSRALGNGVQGVKVFVEPDAGEQPIVDAINTAQKSVYVEMYLLSDTNVISALDNAASKKIDVRVMLEQHPFGGGSPDQTIQDLKSHGAQAQYTNPSFALTHEKGMIIDGTTAYIMTCNLTRSALGGSSAAQNREYGIVDANAADVKTVNDIFTADWNRASYTLDNTNIVLSPVNARSDFTDFINSAKSSLIIEAEEMQDTNVEQAITSAEQRGVKVQVILPTPKSTPDHNQAGIDALKQAGVQVEEDSKNYMHAKMMVADGNLGFVGSENISTNSLDNNRELGVLIADQTVLSTLQSTFQQDLQNSTSV